MKIKREYTIAGVVLGGIALLVFGVNYLKGLDLFQKRNIYYAVYNDVSGITGSSPLFYHGYKVGQVVGTRLMTDGSGRIAVAFQVDADDLKLPRDSRLEIYSADLFTRAAQIVLGDSSVMAQRGDTLLGDAQLSLTETVNQQIDPLKRKAEAMIASVDSVLTSVQGILNKDARGHLDGSFADLHGTMTSVKQTAQRMDALFAAEAESIKLTMENITKLSNTLAANQGRLNNIFANMDSLTSSLASGELQKVLKDLSDTSNELKGTLTKINGGQGTLGQLITNDSLYNNLEASSRQLDLLLEDLRLNPNRYFSVFGKKDKLQKLSDSDVERIQRAMQAAPTK
ncbi:MAG: MCE family protein [Flavobacteriales bacterium]|nr:MCE family protein [Flavobacteriales bacterium]